MKLIAIPLLFLVACSGNRDTNIPVIPHQASELHVQIPKQYTGVWVISSYIEAIKETGSPVKSWNKLGGVVTMVVDASADKDSLLVGASLNNHEGYNFTIYSKSGTRGISFKTSLPDYDDPNGFYEIGANNLKEGMQLCLYHYSKAGQLKETIPFTKIANKQPDHDAGWGIQYVVNEKLIAGRYTLIDSNNVEADILLTNEGQIEGHPFFKTYFIQTDFETEQDPELDYFILNPGTKSTLFYAFTKNGDDIQLYNTIGDEESGFKLGALLYTLKSE